MLRPLVERWEEVQVFLEVGGPVLLLIGAVALVMWTLILERIWFIAFSYPRRARAVLAEWAARPERLSWYAHQIRRQRLSELGRALQGSLPIIKTLIALCPLLGLLGTVSGMIEVFNVMALVGSGNTRAMAAGVSMATIPTMAGMVVAIVGLYVNSRLERWVRKKTGRLADGLTIERGTKCAVV